MDFEWDEKIAGGSLVAGSVLNLSGFIAFWIESGISTLEVEDAIFVVIPLLILGAGVYVYQKRPYNNAVSMVSSILLVLFSVFTVVLLAMGARQDPGLIGVTPVIGIIAGVIALLASIADVIEEFI